MICFELTILFIIFPLIPYIIGKIKEVLAQERQQDWNFDLYKQSAPARRLKKRVGPHSVEFIQLMFEELADEFDGQVIQRTFYHSPRVEFRYKATDVLLSILDTGEGGEEKLQEERLGFYSRLTFKFLKRSPYRIEIYPQTANISIKYLKVVDIIIGDPEFDPKYVIKSSDPDFIKEFLSEDTKKTINKIRSIGSADSVIVSAKGDILIVSKQCIFSSYDQLKEFVGQSLVICDRIQVFIDKLEGLEVLADAQVESLPLCNVCGAEIEENTRVYCKRCRTPLHKSCWDYNGKCAVYACGDTRYTSKY